MSDRLAQAVLKHDPERAVHVLSEQSASPGWSLITLIDELAPLLLMEANLRHSNFHQIKMSLFLRRLTLNGQLTRTTQQAVANLLIREFSKKEWTVVHAPVETSAGPGEKYPSENLISEINNGNIHNAFMYKNHWDPHYFTSLYCAIRLYASETFQNTTAARMAVDQALRYFAQGIRK